MQMFGDTRMNKYLFVPAGVRRLVSLSAGVQPDGTSKADDHLDWSYKCAKSVIRKLRDSRHSAKDLENVLKLGAAQETECICVARSLDGRVQVGDEKGPPHFMYCRLFRWPDLKTYHELRALNCCPNAFHLKKEHICINPYHYTLVTPTALPPVIISRNAQGDVDSRQLAEFNSTAAMGLAMDETEIPENQSTDYSGDMAGSCFSPTGSAVTSGYATSIPPETPPPGYHPDEDLKSPISVTGSTASVYAGSAGPGSPFGSGGSVASFPQGGPRSAASSTDGFRSSPLPYTPRAVDSDETTSIHYQDSPHWCEIRYYEMAQRVGHIFAATIPSITVNGFTQDTAKDMFTLGLCTNPNRTTDAENVRRHIKRGVRLTYIGGEVFAECISDSPIFIQSASSNARYKWNKTTVCKVPPGCHLKIFNNEEFAAALRDAVSKGVQSVHELLRLVNIRISFIKGWGVVYSRKKATQCPCWIEIQLTGPLQWLDKVMVKMSALPPGSSRT
ncbi:mothers against decapentaplegic homolog 3-like isoform X1 [Sycon ciliatum]|uniref:mothers against decapentaplegic homolog 3-like isoform X1 n=1 Tax=Sycon ciliatum TaxID=27933 RepID=UPI0031F69532